MKGFSAGTIEALENTGLLNNDQIWGLKTATRIRAREEFVHIEKIIRELESRKQELQKNYGFTR